MLWRQKSILTCQSELWRDAGAATLANKVYQTISQIMNQEQGKGLSNNKGSAREPGKKNHANEIEGLFFSLYEMIDRRFLFFLFCWVGGEHQLMVSYWRKRYKLFPLFLLMSSVLTDPSSIQQCSPAKVPKAILWKGYLFSAFYCIRGAPADTILYQLKITTD